MVFLTRSSLDRFLISANFVAVKSINDGLKNTDEISIIEMGTYGFGEIREICSWVKPHISVITGIAPVHLERMKSLENILEAKSEIVDFAGSVVINGDDDLLLNQARLWAAQKMVIDCSTTSVKAAVYVSFDSGLHKIYIGGEYICELNAPEILQLSIALSVGVGIFFMIVLNVVHPPAGGNPIMVIIGSVSYDYLIFPVISGCIIIILLAIMINKFLLRKNHPLK